MNRARPLSTCASASQVSALPLTRTLKGAGGDVVSITAVSLTYCAQAFAMAAFGSHTDVSLSPENLDAGRGAFAFGSLTFKGTSHAACAGIGRSGCPGRLG